MNNGRWVILGILAVGILAAAAAWLHRYRQIQRCLEFWGPDVAYLVRLAPEVTLLEIEPVGEQRSADAQVLTVDGKSWQVVRQWDMSKTPGLAHAREALVQDQSFEWESPPAAAPDWQYALRFRKDDQTATLLIDLDHAIVRERNRPGTQTLGIAAGLRSFFKDVTTTPPAREVGRLFEPAAIEVRRTRPAEARAT